MLHLKQTTHKEIYQKLRARRTILITILTYNDGLMQKNKKTKKRSTKNRLRITCRMILIWRTSEHHQ